MFVAGGKFLIYGAWCKQQFGCKGCTCSGDSASYLNACENELTTAPLLPKSDTKLTERKVACH